MKVMLLEQEKTALETRIRDKDKLISKLETDVDSWRDHAKKLQDQAASATRLLEHQKTAETAENEISDSVGQGNPRGVSYWLTAAATVALVVVAVYLWREPIGAAWQSVAASLAAPNSKG